MRDKDWRTLIYSISQGNCILVLGPEVSVREETPAVGPDNLPLPPQFASKGTITLPEMLSNRLSMEVNVTNLDPGELSQVAEFYCIKCGRNDLEAETVSFYQQAPRSEIYAELAKIPFNLVISLTHDAGLIEALAEQGRPPVIETYDFRGDQRASIGLGLDGVGTAQKPLVYNLCGDVSVPRSLVLTESDILDFLSAVMSKNPELPNDLRSQLRDSNKSFLFLGFGLTKWYLRLLFRVLKVNKRETRSFALERLSEEDQHFLRQTILFMKRSQRVESYDIDVGHFVEELRSRIEAAGIRLPAADTPVVTTPDPRPSPAPLGAPKVFISYASEDAVHARKLCESLRGFGFDPWLDEDGLRGGDRWDEVIIDTLDEVDYVVVVQSAALAAKTFSYVNKEIDLALQRQQFARRGIRYVLPVRIDTSPLLDELKHLQTIELHQADGSSTLASTIARDQQRRRKRAA